MYVHAIGARHAQAQSAELARYGIAISTLRREISASDPDSLVGTPSETLCASLLLAQYEVLRLEASHSYVQLSGGVSTILQGCGPSRATASEFELAIFTSQYPAIVTQCLLQGTPCFLNDTAWANAMRCNNGHESIMVVELWIALARIPDAMTAAQTQGAQVRITDCAQLHRIRAAIVAHSEDVSRSLSTMAVHHLYPRAYQGDRLAPNRKTVFSNSDPDLPNRSIKQATFYHACVILINTILQSFLRSSNPALALQTSQSSRYILDCLDFAITTAPFGAFYMTFAGPLCYGVIKDIPEREVLIQSMQIMFSGVNLDWDEHKLEAVF
jgi:hypothetical protein